MSITKTHSRPHVSNDNPFSESHFKTMKYRPDFPDRFGCQEDGLRFCRAFFDWYNTQHHHSGLGFLTHAQVHHGLADGALAHRQRVLSRAHDAHPERFPHGPPRVLAPPREVWINRPTTCSSINLTVDRQPGVVAKSLTRAHIETLMQTASIS